MKETYLTPSIRVELLEKTDVLLASDVIEDNRNIQGAGLNAFLSPKAEDNMNVFNFSLDRFL